MVLESEEKERFRITTIQITLDTWSKLNNLKDFGDTFDDVINRLLEAE